MVHDHHDDAHSVHSVMSDMSVEASDHGDIQETVFEGYDDDDGQQIGVDVAIAKISAFITMCIGADKVKLKSFERRDALIRNTNSNAKDTEKGHSAENEKCLKM